MKIISTSGKWYLMDDSNADVVLTPLDENKVYSIIKTTQTTRSYTANRALHKYFAIVAELLNDAGYSVQYVLNRKRDSKIEKVMDWLYNKTGSELVIKVKEKILSHTDTQISWTGENVKNLLWRPFQKALTSKESTTKISSKDIDLIHRELDKYLSTTYGIESVPFPSIENMLFEQMIKNENI